MAQTSIHLCPCKESSEIHNKREKELDYVRPNLSAHNEWWSCVESLGKLRTQIADIVKEKTGRKMQTKAEPLREGVVVIQEGTTMRQLQELGVRFKERFGVTLVQVAIHRDEGHWVDSEGKSTGTKPTQEPKHGDIWKPNLHAHLVFDWYNHDTGKSIKTTKLDAVEMQTITAEVLGMERGVSSEKKHLEAAEYKAKARMKELKKQMEELNTAKAAKEETINTIKAVGKHAVDFVTGKTKAKENALQERITQLEVQLPTEREKGRQEGGKQVLQAILSAARLKLEDMTPENIGKRWRMWFDKAKSLEQEVKQLKEAAEAQKEAAYRAKINFGNERYREGLKGSQTRIKGLEEDVAELIREYAHGDPDVILHYSTPREDRLFLSPKELERQEAERKKREQEGKKKAPQVTEAPKQERQEEEQRSRGFRR